jgi:hypothetical protein
MDELIIKTTIKWIAICISIGGRIGLILWLILQKGSGPGPDKWDCDSSGNCVKTPCGPFTSRYMCNY